MVKHGRGSVQALRSKHFEIFRKVFDACDKNAASSLYESSKGMIFTGLVRKVFDARVNEIIKKYRDKHFGRHSKKGDGAFYVHEQRRRLKKSET